MCQLLTAEALSALQLVDDTERQLGGNATMCATIAIVWPWCVCRCVGQPSVSVCCWSGSRHATVIHGLVCVCVILRWTTLSARCVVQHDQQRYGVCDPGAFLVWARRDYHSIVCRTGKCAACIVCQLLFTIVFVAGFVPQPNTVDMECYHSTTGFVVVAAQSVITFFF